MKTSKSPQKTEVTPSKKKLMQARLPFKLIADVSPKPDPAHPRKRKLSVPEAEPLTKVGKVCKENDLSKELIEISDDESNDASVQEISNKTVNPLVKLVANARKKKLLKAKSVKKSKTKSKKLPNRPVEKATQSDDQCDDVEMVDVEVIIHEDDSAKSSPNAEKTAKKEGTSVESDSLDKGSSLLSSEKPSCEQLPDPIDTGSRKTCAKESKTSQESQDDKKKTAITLDKIDMEVSEPGNTSKSKLGLLNNVTPKRSTRNNKTSTSPDVKLRPIDDINKSLNESQSSDSRKCLLSEENSHSHLAENDKLQSLDGYQTDDGNKKEDSDSAAQLEKLKVQNNVTPKRSPRKKFKADEKLNPNSSTVSLKLDDTVCSSPETPKHNKSIKDDVLNSPAALASLTPKQLQKRLESAKKREEREKEKLEREKKRQEEKEERAKQRQEKEDQKRKEREDKEEAKKREKEEKEELKRKEREEKEIERKQKEDEKRKEKEKKEELRLKEKEAREEERRKKQEALDLEKQEQELKKKKAAEAFANFFVPKQKTEKDQSVVPSKSSMLSSFTIKGDMRLAPTVRVDLSEEQREALDTFLLKQGSSDELYLACLKEGNQPKSSGKTWPLSDKNDEDDVMIVEDELPPLDGAGEIITCEPAPREKLRPKLLSFHQNRRPPYWGTWRKKSAVVKPRKPFGQDEKLMDYEVDSDDDWEEEQEGESLDGSVCGSEEDGEPRDDYEVDNELFVPHGYLSDEEGTMDEEDVLSLSPETQKARLKNLEDEFESEMKKPTEKLKPRMYGLLWEDGDGGKPENCVDALWNYFSKFSMIMDDPLPYLQPSKDPEETEKKKIKKKKVSAEGTVASPKSEKKKKIKPETTEGRKTKAEPKKILPNQPGINSFLFSKFKST